MHLTDCWGFNSLKTNSPSLHSFEIFDCYDEKEDGTLLEISETYLKDLHVFVNPTRSKLQLTDISSLEKACIDVKVGILNWLRRMRWMIFERTLHIAELELELRPSLFELPQSRRICRN